jgi:hypothetical protein
VKIKGKHLTETWASEIEIKNANPIEVMELHRATSEVLTHMVDDQGKGNAQLKQRMAELEVSLSHKALFAQPISIVWPIEDS